MSRREENERRDLQRRLDRIERAQKHTGSHAAADPQVKAERDRNGDVLSQAFAGLARWVWRHRWQLVPLVMFGAVVMAAATSPAAAALGAFGLFGLGQLAEKKAPEQILGRPWLSLRERSIVSLWAAGAAAWCATVAADAWSATEPLALVTLAALTGAQSVQWGMSRHIRPVKLSKRAKDLQAGWSQNAGAPWGPKPLQGSKIVPGSLVDLPGNGLNYRLRLLNHHADDAATDEVRKRLEVLRKLPRNSVQLQPIAEDSAVVEVTETPGRHLETTDAVWTGELRPDGMMPFATTPSGRTVDIPLHDASRVKHVGVVGVTATGKSNSIAAVILPGVLAQREVVWYCDGKRGSSVGFLAGACDWWAIDEDAWIAAILTFNAVLTDRMRRRSARGLSKWRGAAEKDPILTLVLDETSIIGQAIPPSLHTMIEKATRASTAFGARIIEGTQDALGSDWIGGRVARDQIGGGGVLIGHRPGSGTGAVLSAGTTAESIDLRSLPGGPGWVGVIVQGQVVAPKAKVGFAEPVARERLDGFTAGGMTKADLMAAMSAGTGYRDRLTGKAAAEAMARANEVDEDDAEPPADAPLRVPEPMILQHADVSPIDRALEASARAAQAGRELNGPAQKAQEQAEASRATICEFLAGLPAGANATQVGAALGMPRQTASRHLAHLEKDGRVTKDQTTGIYSRAESAVSA